MTEKTASSGGIPSQPLDTKRASRKAPPIASCCADDQCGTPAAKSPHPHAEHAEHAGHDHDHPDEHGHDHDHEHGAETGIARLSIALALALVAEVLHLMFADAPFAKGAGLVVAAIAIWLSGFETYKNGLSSLSRGKLNINALMSVAVTGAFVIGQWPEAAMVMALYAFAELIEGKAAERARNSIQGLVSLAPEEALVRQADGAWKTIASSEVKIDDLIRIKPGERVALDGVVSSGSTAINQAPVTGESLPVDKTVGDAVYAGTINDTGEIEVRVTAEANDTTLARIIHAVEEAQSTRAPTQKFIDKFASIYTPSVFVFALLIAIGLPLVFGFTWLDAIYKALVMLVVACPCALVISTPVTVVSALAAAAKRGILIKGGVYLEGARKLRAIALDKTGTITEGKPKLVEWKALDETAGDRIETLAKSLSSRSDHPVSIAISKGLEVQGVEVTDFEALPGRGVQGTVEGEVYALANHRLAVEKNFSSAELESALSAQESRGRSVTLLIGSSQVLAWFAVADTIKQSSREAVSQLKALGVHAVMLTGDNAAAANTIASEAGVAEVQGNLLPQDKLSAIKSLQQKYGDIGMTGDGINDAPALAQSNIGFAMGGAGTDTAMEAADIVIMNDDLRRIPETIRLSKKAHSVLWQNITVALGIKLVFMVLALTGSATMWMAVFADMGATLLVVANGLRLMKGVAK